MKKTLRNEFINKRLTYKLSEKESNIIVKKLINLPEIKKAKYILLYYPHKNEVNILPLFQILKGKILLLPRTDSKDIFPVMVNSLENLKKGKFGILEPEGNPVQIEKIDVVIVPAIAFDKKGHRLGYGKGYYDRFLKNFKGTKIGVAYDFQVVEEIPKEEHDIPVDLIITPSQIIKVKEEQ
ncbi:MAG: 5-formyltetrahydrofolate cyclo-ligase [Aquificota bacterium]|nr:MAG: 5-formyltetrahydrofolate cyclo-ligase [Aquificota bacterium]